VGIEYSLGEYWKEHPMANIEVGERFPTFILPDEQGEPFNLRSELADGPLMLVFYRGDW
jgi:peroxiredoxin